MASKKLFRIRHQKQIYIHNTLDDASFYFQRRVSDRKADEKREGIGYEIIAGLLMTAFTFEARLNFLGYKKVKDWNERDPFRTKLRLVLSALKLDLNTNEHDQKTIMSLKDFRDQLAHGKPVETEIEEEIEATEEELDNRRLLNSDWEKLATPDFLDAAIIAADGLWQTFLAAAKLEIWDTMSRGSIHISLLQDSTNEGPNVK